MGFPALAPRLPDRTPRSARLQRRLADDESRRLLQAIDDAGLPVADALLAGFVTLVARYSAGQPPPIAARDAARAPGSRFTVIALTWDSAEVFRSLAGRARGALDGRAPDAGASLSFSFEEPTGEATAELAAGRELALTVRHDARGLELDVTYDGGLFDEPFIARFVDHLLILTRAGATAPERRGSRLQLLDDDEQRRIVGEWNDTAEPYPRELRVQEWFEEEAQRHPTHIAASFPADGEALTYGELDAQANRVADHLYRRGALGDELVGVFDARSARTLAAILGVWKAGAAVLPLDPAAPRAILSRILEAGECRFLLTDGADDTFRGDAELMRVAEVLAADHAPMPPLTGRDPEQLACALFDGSDPTALALIPHRALVNVLDTLRRRPGIDQDDRLLSLAPLSASLGLIEWMLPLVAGGTLVVARELDDDNATGALISAEAVTVLPATPRRWESLLVACPTAATGLRALCSAPSAPALTSSLLRQARELWSLHGYPETAGCALVERVLGEEHLDILGRPIGNTAAYVLDDYQQPVPAFVEGWLYVGGDGVARGYQGRSARTGERFGPDPFRHEGGARMFRSGDRARLRDDGRVELVARAPTESASPSESVVVDREGAAQARPAPRALRVLQTGDRTRAPVLCVAEHERDEFSALAERTDRARPFVAVHGRAVDDDDRSLDDVQFHISEIMKSYPADVAAVLGAGDDGALAFRLAAALTRAGMSPPLVVLVDAPGPGVTYVGEKLAHLAAHLENLRRRPVRQRVRYVSDWLRTARRPGPRSDVAKRSARAYPGRGLLLRSLGLPLDLEARHDPMYGWSGLFSEGLEVIELRTRAGHLLEEPWVRTIAEPLRQALDRADREHAAELRTRPRQRR